MTTATQIKPFPLLEMQYDEGNASQQQIKTELSTLIPAEHALRQAPHLQVPLELSLGFLRDGRLRVRSPIKVIFTQENDQVIAEAPEFNEFGFGKNFSEALSDLQNAMAELFFTLEVEKGRLGPDLQTVWNDLQRKVSKIEVK